MSRRHLKRDPHRSKDGSWWWYEENVGITVRPPDVSPPGARIVTIPWTAIRRALARKDRKP